MHPLKKTQIALLKADEAFTKVLSKYADFASIFSWKSAVQLSKYMRINNHAIEFVEDWQLSYSSIYSLGLVELEILKAYIENNPANSFIKPSKFLAKAFILFNKKPNSGQKFCIDYWGLTNLKIKNRYLLPLVRALLDWIGWAQHFIQLNLTNTYYEIKIKEDNE